jgi:L-alanine-DL-glutamate epimerase-like enolase superfamily enzyme
MFDPNNNYDFRKALTVGRALDANGFHWFEDPVPWDDFDAVVELSRRLDTPLAMSDLAGYLFREPAHYIRLGAPRILRATARKHGITGMRKIAGMAEAFGLNCEIGTAGNSSLNAANLHVICSISNCDYYEWWMPAEAHQFGLVDHYGLNERMALEVPEIPGLGCVLDEEWIAAHRVETLE